MVIYTFCKAIILLLSDFISSVLPGFRSVRCRCWCGSVRYLWKIQLHLTHILPSCGILCLWKELKDPDIRSSCWSLPPSVWILCICIYKIYIFSYTVPPYGHVHLRLRYSYIVLLVILSYLYVGFFITIYCINSCICYNLGSDSYLYDMSVWIVIYL